MGAVSDEDVGTGSLGSAERQREGCPDAEVGGFDCISWHDGPADE